MSKIRTSLGEMGVVSRADLQQAGAFEAFIRCCQQGNIKSSLNFFNAMAEALEGPR